jgi:hypothetical protein
MALQEFIFFLEKTPPLRVEMNRGVKIGFSTNTGRGLSYPGREPRPLRWLGNIVGTASRACGPVGSGRWHEAGSSTLQGGVVHEELKAITTAFLPSKSTRAGLNIADKSIKRKRNKHNCALH